MATKEVIYSGYDKTTSDYECPDGQLEASFNLINEDGSLKPLPQPVEVLKLPKGYKPLFIHTTQDYRHLIMQKVVKVLGRTLHFVLWVDYDWLTGSDTPPTIDEIERRLQPVCDGLGEVMAINAVKNTLCIMFASGLHYILWKATGNAYKYLGQKPPFVELKFGTTGRQASVYPSLHGSDRRQYSAWVNSKINVLESIGNKADVVDKTSFNLNGKSSEITDAVYALINKTNAAITGDGNFYAPFFVRYAYRMFDGSVIMHSAPVLMPLTLPSAYRVEVVNLFCYGGKIDRLFFMEDSHPYDSLYSVEVEDDCDNEITEDGGDFDENVILRYVPENVKLTYSTTTQSDELDSLKQEWGDIIESIDIFITPPILREDLSKKITSIKVHTNGEYFTHTNRFNNLPVQHVKYKTGTTYGNYVSGRYTQAYCDIPLLSEEAYYNNINNTGVFYKVKSYKLDESFETGEDIIVSIDGATLAALSEQETLVDDYKTHNILLPDNSSDIALSLSSMYSYNSRLNVANVRELLFGGYSTRSIIPKLGATNTAHLVYVSRLFVFLETEEGEKIVVSEEETRSGRGTVRLYYWPLLHNPLFYSDNRATKMVIEYKKTGDSGWRYAEFPMEQCPLLNGAWTKCNIVSSISGEELPAASTDTIAKLAAVSEETAIVSAGNKIYTSEVDNPFLFPATSINTVGSGRILNIAANTTALSQGQFGQHPFYAFATDGVWALSVSDTGTYIAVQPVSRDVCINPVSVTQTDNAILFITDRGIMMLTGSVTTCISDSLDDEMSGAPVLPQLDKIYTIAGISTGEATGIVPFRTYCHDAGMLFDYMHQRLLVYNLAYAYMYAYSFKSKKWGMMQSNIAHTIGAYPEALVVSRDGGIVSFDKVDETTDTINGLFITRPLKLGMADVLKSVYTVIQRGMFRRGDVSTVLYGSRDLYSWHLIGSSQDHYLRGLRGTPYKYFRIVGIARLGKGQSLSGATLEIEPRHIHRLH